MSLNYLAGNRKSKTGSLSIAARSPIEFVEDPGLLLLANPRPGIADTETHKLAPMGLSFQKYFGPSIPVLDRIGYKI
jgi:hypothetical protein